ncbi:12877_t:CDS:2, partial [Acaulospora colombiana]
INVSLDENSNNSLCLPEDSISDISSYNENETSVLDDIQDHRDKAESHFAEGNYVKALEIWEIILKDPRHTPKDRN